MTQQTFNTAAGIMFGFIVVLHGLRIVFRWEAMIGGWVVPRWISWVAVLVFGGLAYVAFKQK